MRLREAIDEQDFLDCSYGFGQVGAHLRHFTPYASGACRRASAGSWRQMSVESFDSMARTRLREGLRQRVNEGRILRRMGKWLRAGVREEGELSLSLIHI